MLAVECCLEMKTSHFSKTFSFRKRLQTSCASAQCRLLLKIQTRQQDILHEAFFHDQVQEKDRGSLSGGVALR